MRIPPITEQELQAAMPKTADGLEEMITGLEMSQPAIAEYLSFNFGNACDMHGVDNAARETLTHTVKFLTAGILATLDKKE